MRGITAEENLVADVEGDITEDGGVIRVSAIRVRYRLKVPTDLRDKAQRALDTYSKGCPAYHSIRDCIDCTWSAEFEDDG